MHPVARRVLAILTTAVMVIGGALLFVFSAVLVVGYGAMGAMFGSQVGLVAIEFIEYVAIGWAICGAVVGAALALGGLAYAANSLAKALGDAGGR